MIKLLTGAEMRELDRAAGETYGLAGIVLMEHAGTAVARAARDLLGPGPAHVCLVCGKGANGGDGFVAARWLARWGFVPEVFLVGARDEVGGDARVNLDLLGRLNIKVETLAEEPDLVLLAGSLRRCRLVVDALLGTGGAGPPRGIHAAAIRHVTASRLPILSVDVPSGLNADTGECFDPHLMADLTVTFGAWKRGLALAPGSAAAGRVELIDIGLPAALLDELDRAPALVEAADVAALLPPRPADCDKWRAGRVLLVAGSRRLCGAALLTARGSARGGAGLTSLAAPPAVVTALQASLPEVMAVPLPEAEDGAVGPGAFELIEPLLAGVKAVALGPGLGLGEGVAQLLSRMLAGCDAPVVLDADGLTLLAAQPELLDGQPRGLILTPHEREAARLLGVEPKRVAGDRLGAAGAISRRFGAVTVLKGARTVIAAPERPLRLNPTGCAAMASGGMGDALTGLLAALLAQGLPPAEAAVAGVWLHGRAGELAAAGCDTGLLASDLCAALPRARAELHHAASEDARRAGR